MHPICIYIYIIYHANPCCTARGTTSDDLRKTQQAQHGTEPWKSCSMVPNHHKRFSASLSTSQNWLKGNLWTSTGNPLFWGWKPCFTCKCFLQPIHWLQTTVFEICWGHNVVMYVLFWSTNHFLQRSESTPGSCAVVICIYLSSETCHVALWRRCFWLFGWYINPLELLDIQSLHVCYVGQVGHF